MVVVTFDWVPSSVLNGHLKWNHSNKTRNKLWFMSIFQNKCKLYLFFFYRELCIKSSQLWSCSTAVTNVLWLAKNRSSSQTDKHQKSYSECDQEYHHVKYVNPLLANLRMHILHTVLIISLVINKENLFSNQECLERGVHFPYSHNLNGLSSCDNVWRNWMLDSPMG